MSVARDSAGFQRRLYEPYVQAGWGLRNCWYPAAFTSEVREDGMFGTRILGEPIVLRRSNGRVYALSDRCPHRGVKLSARPTCLSKDTLSCWYHGFTFDVATGSLKTILAAPNDDLIGKISLRTYPAEEVNGMIYVFVGDEKNQNVPPLAADLPAPLPSDHPFPVAHPLDENAVLLGIHRTTSANWRLAAENGFDIGHLFIHRNARMVVANRMPLALGYTPKNGEGVRTVDAGLQKGVVAEINPYTYDIAFGNEAVGLPPRFPIDANAEKYLRAFGLSLWMPGVLRVSNWPGPGLVQYEWYVPIDDRQTEYWAVIGKRCASPEERDKFQLDYEIWMRDLALINFNDDDIFAREHMQSFYEDGSGWSKEQLFSVDAGIVTWRKLVARHNRGIQTGPRGG